MICRDISNCGYSLSREIQYQRVWMLMHCKSGVLSLQAYLISSLLYIWMTGLLSRIAMLPWTALLQVNPVIKGHYSGEGNWVWIELDTAVDWSRQTSRQKPCVWEAAREVNVITGCLPYQSGLKDSIKPVDSVGRNSNPRFRLTEYPQTPVRFLCLLRDPVHSTGARLPYFSSVLSRTSDIGLCGWSDHRNAEEDTFNLSRQNCP